jgi:hypothetical protein
VLSGFINSRLYPREARGNNHRKQTQYATTVNPRRDQPLPNQISKTAAAFTASKHKTATRKCNVMPLRTMGHAARGTRQSASRTVTPVTYRVRRHRARPPCWALRLHANVLRRAATTDAYSRRRKEVPITLECQISLFSSSGTGRNRADIVIAVICTVLAFTVLSLYDAQVCASGMMSVMAIFRQLWC